MIGRVCLFVLLLACASSFAAREAGDSSKTVCEVLQDVSAWNGVLVTIRADYASDGIHEEVLEDDDCEGGSRILDIGRRGTAESVVVFYSERMERCDARGATHLCNTRATVEMAGEVGLMNGEIVFHVHEVVSLTFR